MLLPVTLFSHCYDWVIFTEQLHLRLQYSILYVYIYVHHIFFTHSSINGHLGCFRTLAIVNSSAVNTGVCSSFWISVFSRYLPRSEIAGLHGRPHFSLSLWVWFAFIMLADGVGQLFPSPGFLPLRPDQSLSKKLKLNLKSSGVPGCHAFCRAEKPDCS